HVAFQIVAIFAEKRIQIRTADLLLAFDHQMQIHRQPTMLLDRFLNSENVRKDLAFVVRCAARKNITVFQHRLERRRIPKLQRIRRLHVVMAVDQNGSASGFMLIPRPNDRMSSRGYKLRLQTDTVKLVHQPVCTLDQLFLVLIVSRDAWKPQERVILLKIIVAHGCKSKSTLRETSNRERKSGCEPNSVTGLPARSVEFARLAAWRPSQPSWLTSGTRQAITESGVHAP